MEGPYWFGKVRISLVSFGVGLYTATETKEENAFRQMSRRTGGRVRHQKELNSSFESESDQPGTVVHSDYFRDIKKTEVSADSLELAEALIAKRAAKFDLSKFEDGYEIALKELVNAKINHLPVPKDEIPQLSTGKVVNLMDALRKSIGTETKVPKKPAASAKDLSRRGIGLIKAPKAAKRL